MPPTCRTCRLPPVLRDQVADQYRRGVPLRSIAADLAEAGHPVHRDAIHRHVRAHVAPADLFDVEHSPADTAAGLTVAAVVAGQLTRWPSLAASTAAALRAEGLTGPAEVVFATAPETMRTALVAAAGTPTSEVMQARLLVKAMRRVLGAAHPEASRAIAAVLRSDGADDLADALEDLAAAVESSPDPDERAREVQVRALRAARSVGDSGERKRALNEYARMYGPPSPELVDLAVYGTTTSAPVGGERRERLPAHREPQPRQKEPT